MLFFKMIIAELGNLLNLVGFKESISSTHGLTDCIENKGVIYSKIDPVFAKGDIQRYLDITILCNLDEKYPFVYGEDDLNYINFMEINKLNIDILIISNENIYECIAKLIAHFKHNPAKHIIFSKTNKSSYANTLELAYIGDYFIEKKVYDLATKKRNSYYTIIRECAMSILQKVKQIIVIYFYLIDSATA